MVPLKSAPWIVFSARWARWSAPPSAALGAPFEFGLAGEFSGRFPSGGEMCGGRGWDPGEATDDTQMALHVAQSMLEHNGLDLPDIFARYQR